MRKLTFSAIFASLFAIPFASAYSEHSVASDLSHFVQAFQALFKAQTGSFAHHLVQSLPVIGLLVVVYGLMFFILRITLFSDKVMGDQNKDINKYANALAIGFAILGLAQQSVYNAILNWSRTFLIFVFLIAIIAMASLFYMHWRKRHFQERKEQLDAKKAFLPVKRETQKLKHDLAMQEKTYDKVDHDLNYLKNELRDIDQLAGKEDKQVDKLLSLVSRAAAAYRMDKDEKDTRQYSNVLSSAITKLVASMKHEPKHFTKFQSLLQDIENKLNAWENIVDDDSKDISRDEKILRRIRRYHPKNKDIRDEDLHLLKNDEKIKESLRLLNIELDELKKHHKTMKHYNSELVHHTLHTKFKHAEDARSAIYKFNYDDAERHLKSLKDQLLKEKDALAVLRQEEQNIKSILSSINKNERYLHKLDIKEIVELSKHK